MRWAARLLCGWVMSWAGCGWFDEPAPPPPPAAERAAMRQEQAKQQAPRNAVQQRVDEIRAEGAPEEEAEEPPRLRSHEQWTLAETAADSLGRIGQPAVSALRELLRDPRPHVRLRAADVLARVGPEAAAAVPDLIVRLRDTDPEVRKAAARALGQIGPAAEAAVPDLIQLLDHEPVR